MKKNVFGSRLSELRKKRNMTQRDLAAKLEKSTSTIAMWELGSRDPDSEMLSKISLLFNVSTDYLLGVSDTPVIVYEKGSMGWLLNLTENEYLDYFYENANKGLVESLGRKNNLIEIIEELNSVFKILGYDNLIYRSKDTNSDSLIMHLEIINHIMNEAETAQDLQMIDSVTEVVDAFRKKDDNHIPIVGTICAGDGLLAEQNIEGYIRYPFIDRKQPDFALIINGNSMMNAGILDGDIVFLRKAQWAEFNGQIVAAIVNEDTGTLKRMKWSENSPVIKLIPENEDYQEIEARPNEIQVCGVYMGFFRPEKNGIIALGFDL